MTADTRLAATIAICAAALVAVYLAVCHASYDPNQCGRIGGCDWMQGT
jgi:hypothetical protein